MDPVMPRIFKEQLTQFDKYVWFYKAQTESKACSRMVGVAPHKLNNCISIKLETESLIHIRPQIYYIRPT